MYCTYVPGREKRDPRSAVDAEYIDGIDVDGNDVDPFKLGIGRRTEQQLQHQEADEGGGDVWWSWRCYDGCEIRDCTCFLPSGFPFLLSIR